MKKTIILTLILSALLLGSCEKETILSIDQTSITVSDIGGTQSVSLTANKPWTASSNQSWCKVSPSSGEEAESSRITITCDANTTYDARSCTITFTCAELKKTVEVSQATNNGLMVSQTSYEVTKAAQQLSIEVKANVKFSVEVDNSCKDWVKYKTTKGLTTSTVVLDIAENQTYDSREGKVTIKQDGGSLSSTITIKQSQLDGLFITTPEYNLSNEKHTLTVEVKSNIEFEVNSEADWIKYIETKGLKTNQIILDIAANESYDLREGRVTVKQKNGALAGVITIVQQQSNGLFTSPSSFELTNDAQSIQIEVKHNIKYSVIIPDSAKDWVSIQNTASTKALETSALNLIIAENESFDSRSCEVTIKAIDNALATTIRLSQRQKSYIEIGEDVYEFDREGGQFTVELCHSVDFDVEISDNWVTEFSTKSLVTSSRSFSVAQNDSGKERTATITFLSRDRKSIQSIRVNQGMTTTIVTSEKYIVMNHLGGDFNIDINPIVDFDFVDHYYNDANEITMPISLISIAEPRIHVSVGRNVSDKICCADIIVTDCATGQKDTVRIRVNPQDYGSTYSEISYEQTKITIPIETPWEFTAELKEPADWISISGLTTGFPQAVSLQVDENKIDAIRRATLILRFPDGVIQEEINLQQNSDTYHENIIMSEAQIEYIRKMKFKIIDGYVWSGCLMSDLDNMIEEITGDFVVQGIPSFDGLYGLRKIGGDLQMYSTTTLPSTEGLNNLEYIGGDIYCNDHTTCYDVPYGPVNNQGEHGFADNIFILRKLKAVGGSITIDLNGNLASLVGLENLESIGGEVVLKNVSSLNGLNHITQLQSLSVEGASSFVGLDNLIQVENNVTIINGEFESFQGLHNLRYIGGDFKIYNNFEYRTFYNNNAFSKITSLNGLSALTEIGGNFVIWGTLRYLASFCHGFPNLVSLSGLNSLSRIGGSLKIGSDGDRRIYSFENLKSIDIASLKEIGGDLKITMNGNKLNDFSFSSLEEIGGRIDYWDAQDDRLGIITKGSKRLKSVSNIHAVCAFEKEEDGFTSLESITNLEGNGVGFPSLKEIKENFTITGNSNRSIGEMRSLEQIGGNLEISNTCVTEINSMNNLSTVKGSIIINDNHFLSSIYGFKSLTNANSISIKNQILLYDFSAFVTAVLNGSSWSCSGCGYNPTKYQMQHGEAKQE